MELLVVCTANVCRSQMVAAFLRARVGDAPVDVLTAGVLPGRRPIDPSAQQALAVHHLAAPTVTSRQVAAADVRSADLVLCLERRHVRDVVVLDREAFARTFTLRELVRRGEQEGPRPPGTSMGDYLERLGRARDLASLVQDAPDEDVADPTGGPLSSYLHTANWLEGLVDRAVGLLFPHGQVGPDLEPDDDLDVGAAFAGSGPGQPEVQRWRNRNGARGGLTVGVAAEKTGLRLARSVTQALEAQGYTVEGDVGERWLGRSWPSTVELALDALAAGDVDDVVVLVGSTIGAVALANRDPSARAAAPTDVSTARRARRDFGANVLCLGSDETTQRQAEDITFAFLATEPTVPPELAPPPA